ncbi:hypothetical protein Tco_0007332 [Tanacetum coccineum]
MQNLNDHLTEMLTKFHECNSALLRARVHFIATPLLTVGDIEAIPRSGVSYDGPQVPPPPSSLPKVVKHAPEESPLRAMASRTDFIQHAEI